MATRWSSEFIIAEHRDLQASAMAADCTGTFVLLAGRRYLGLKKLDDSTDMLRKIPRQSKYYVGTAEWNPNVHTENLCAISSNQRVEIHKLDNSELLQIHLLNAHTRVVTDLNWHRFHPEVIATCSVDTYTHIWDLRDARRPSLSLSSVAGANRVRWNRLSQYLLATAHHGDIRLWDQRKGTAPVQYITAHLANIHGLDWSQTHENQLVTSSQDCTVKFFDTTNPRKAENTIPATAPVWRAQYTPFGEGLLMVVVPPTRRGENCLLLWNLGNHNAPVHTFVGHTDTVLEVEWRRHKHESSDYQLITWSKDQTLRIWQIEPFLQKLCGHDPDCDTSSSADVINTTSTLENEGDSEILMDTASSTISDDSQTESENLLSSSSSQTGLTQPKTLQQEFSLININISNISFDKMDAVRRSCLVKVTVNSHHVVLNITFPPSYPFGCAPTFQFATGSTVDIILKTKLLKVVKHTAQQRVLRNRSCLEPCLRQLVATLEQLSNNEDSDKANTHHQMSPVSIKDHSALTSFQDISVPYHRTSGAKFCSVGLLVTFGRSISARRLSTRPEAPTPRSLAALPDPGLGMSSSYFFHDRVSGVPARSRMGRGLGRGQASRASKSLVIIYDVSSLFFVQRNLAEKYIFDSQNLASMCQRNAAVAASVGRRDLVQAWSLATLATSHPSLDHDDEFPWHTHPFAKGLLQSIIWHFAKQYDVQTAAMLTCVFNSRLESSAATKHKSLNKANYPSPGGSPYHTIHQVDTTVQGWTFSVLKQNRSNSWSESLDDCRLSNIVEHFSVHTEIDRSLEIDDSYIQLYDEYKRVYAEILHRWKLLDARTQVLKYMSTVPEPHRGVELKADCQHCRKPGQDAYCNSCKRPAVQCVICHLSVKGVISGCLVCGHGGHAAHMQDWFRTESVCPSGCGCHCLTESASVLEP